MSEMGKSWREEILEPLNLTLLAASGWLIYKILSDVFHTPKVYVPPPKLEKDMTIKELRKYNGKDDPQICIGIKGEIFNVTRGSNFYGPNGPYNAFAGRDASRAFANFSTDDEMFKDGDDDLSDLTPSEQSQLNDWYDNLSSKYDKVGNIIREDKKSI